jgi:GntR family transcriptional regulator, arabinose operon transcriptional repressor
MKVTEARKNLERILASLRQKLETEWKIGDRLPTSRELAAEFSCSIGAVSKAIALLSQEGWVEQRKRAGTRVLRSAKDEAAKRIESLAFIYPSDLHEGILKSVKGFQEAAKKKQRRLIMLTTGSDYHKESEYIARLAEFDVRGAVIYPILPTPEAQVYFTQMLASTPFPVVIRGMKLPGLGRPSVTQDGFHAGYTMTRHLLDQGIQRIGFFSNYAWVSTMRDRYRGYVWAMEERNLPIRPEWTMIDPMSHPNDADPLAEPIELARHYFEKAGNIQAVVCADDFFALACIRVAKERGLRVPEDLRVTGIGDYDSAVHSETPLTTYHIPYEEMGRKTFDVLESLIKGELQGAEEFEVRGHLVVRQSG